VGQNCQQISVFLPPFGELKHRRLVECRKLDHSIVVEAFMGGVVSLLASGLTMDILSRFCDVFMVQCVKLILIIFEFRVLLFYCFVYRQNVICLKRFTRYVSNTRTCEVEDIIIG